MFINNKFGKVWGTTQEIFNFNNTSISRIEIIKGGQCSKHKHEYKYNMFFIEKGKLQINIWQNDYSLIDTSILYDHDSLTISPKLFHEFIALEETIAYEIYYTKLENNDIIRETCGKLNKII